TQDELLAAVGAAVDDWGPFSVKISGHGRFALDDGTECLHALVDGAELPDFRQSIIRHLQAAGIQPVLNHGYTPHITLSYEPGEGPDPMPPLLEWTVNSVDVVWAGEHVTVLFGSKS